MTALGAPFKLVGKPNPPAVTPDLPAHFCGGDFLTVQDRPGILSVTRIVAMKERIMKRTRVFLLAGLVLLPLSGCGDHTTKPAPAQPAVQSLLNQVQAQRRVPAMAAAVLNGDGIIDSGFGGVRKLGESDVVTGGDLYDLGSNVKAMTATLIAFEVHEGRVSWDATLAGIWPEFADGMDPAWSRVTIEEVLHHRAGLPAWETADDILALPDFPGDLCSQRQALARWLLAQAPAFPVGEFHYSNAGYALAGAILEKVSGATWESLLQSRLLGPLGMNASFGWPAANGAHQPWGHVDDGSGGLVPFDPDGPLQFPPFLRPMGNLSLSVTDYAKFVLMHLRGLRGRDGVLPAEVIRRLHRSDGGYAMGWGVQRYQGRTVSFHLGSADIYSAFAIIDPDANRAAVVLANGGNAASQDATQELALKLIAR
jgi:CubicO group peptidase (beta-lactamase class C family)